MINKCVVLDIHRCAFGSHWRRATRLVFGGQSDRCFHSLFSYRFQCHGKHRIFAAAAKGTNIGLLRSSLTRQSAQYPPRLVAFIAGLLMDPWLISDRSYTSVMNFGLGEDFGRTENEITLCLRRQTSGDSSSLSQVRVGILQESPCVSSIAASQAAAFQQAGHLTKPLRAQQKARTQNSFRDQRSQLSHAHRGKKSRINRVTIHSTKTTRSLPNVTLPPPSEPPSHSTFEPPRMSPYDDSYREKDNLEFENFPTLASLNCWHLTFRTEVCWHPPESVKQKTNEGCKIGEGMRFFTQKQQ